MQSKSIGFLIGASIVVLGAVALVGLIIQILWNKCLVPAIDPINTINYYQAIGIYILSTILFKTVNLKPKNDK
jgi:hypothetical protein